MFAAFQRCRQPRVFVPGLAAAALALMLLAAAVFFSWGDAPHWEEEEHVNVVPRESWGARPARSSTAPLVPLWWAIVFHHTETDACLEREQCVKQVRELQREHMDVRAPALDDIEFNFLVGGDGAVYEGRGWDAVGRPLGGWHHESLSVAMIGTFHQRQPTAAQADAALRFVEWAMSDLERIRTDYRAAGACQFEDTDSPGARIMDMLVVWPHWWNHSTVDAPCIPMRKAQSALS